MTDSQRQISLFPECGDQCRAVLHGTQTSSGKVTDLSKRAGAEVTDLMGLQIAPEIFHRVEFRRVSRQERQLDVHVVTLNVPAHHFAFMRLQTIPNDEQGAVNLTSECREKLDDLRSFDAAWKQTEVKLPEAYPRYSGELFPREAVLQDWCLSAGCPGAHPRGTFGKPRLVDENYGLAAFFGVFFSAGHCRCFHSRMAGSLRWMARPVGRWQLKPSSRSNRHTCTSLYCRPKRFAITVRTRGRVHSSVGKPAASAPRLSRCASSRRCAAPNPPGRPRGLALSACWPSASSFFAQVCTDWRLTPTRRATSAWGRLCSSSRTARSLRRCSAFRSRFISRSTCHCHTTYVTSRMRKSVSHLCKSQ